MDNIQNDLFATARTLLRIETPASHRSDPETSRIAEQFVTKTGIRENQRQRTLDAVRKWPGRTSAELAREVTQPHEEESAIRSMLARRLSECETAGAVRKGARLTCTVKGRPAVTWWPK